MKPEIRLSNLEPGSLFRMKGNIYHFESRYFGINVIRRLMIINNNVEIGPIEHGNDDSFVEKL